MKIRNILYISLVLLIAGCTNEENFSDTLSGNGKKTPLLINATINTGRADTRAADNTFAVNDQLKVYIRHTTGEEGGTGVGHYTYITPTPDPDYANQLVTINVTSAGTSPSLSPIYWDDFSNSATDATDLRTSGHGLQSYYSYCYNGGTPTTALNESTSVLGWTVSTEQNTDTNLQNSDILWSPEQATVPYSHSTAYDSGHGDFPIPYKHAMSEVTVTVTAAAGFVGSTNPLSSTVLTLNAMNTVTELNARLQSFSPLKQETAENIKSVTMRAEAYTSGTLTRNYTAIVAPGTILKEDVKLLDITNAQGNDYTVTITAAMLSTDDGKWGNGLSEPNQKGTDGGGKHYIVTQPGVNYHLDVTINKSSVQTHATLADWTTVNASGTGDIVLNDDDTNLIMDDGDVTGITDVDIVGVDKNHFDNGSSFSLFRVIHDAAHDTPAERTNNTYDFATVSTFHDNDNPANDEWTKDPEIYWPNITDNFYYRALAKFNSSTGTGSNIVNNITSVGTYDTDKGTSVSQGTTAASDILWGTTPKHRGFSGATYARGGNIPPRKGGVPIAFEHAMSKVSFALETTNDASVLPTNAKVDITGATIAIINLHTSGTISIESGAITGSGINSYAAGATSAIPVQAFPISNLFVIPQDFSNGDAKLVITLPNYDNAVYSIPLKDCVVSGGSTPITAWERGKNYSYTIKIKKEAVQFHVQVKDWDVVNGSGNATLDW